MIEEEKKAMTAQDPTTNNPFDAKQQATLSALAVLIIPPSVEYNIPGADDSQIFENIVTLCEQKAQFVSAQLNAIEQTQTQAQFKETFLEAGVDAQMQVVETIGRDSPFFAFLLTAVVQCYYQDDRVLQSLQIEPRPPFPLGHEVEQGDWSLLETVRSRGKIYREIS
ncbi:MAG TPA: hypothetical protein EYG15_08325 [Deltaproteobacteria bacterium]|nr:hypothetical protein [Candidatus Lambdaproteobacteria bacterium]HIL16084.1 hypothetical protein [Deltaproteobacteria bacterium]